MSTTSDPITPEHLYFNRRTLMKAGILAASTLATGAVYRALNAPSRKAVTTERIEVTASTAPADSGFRTDEPPTSLENITHSAINNPDDDPLRHAIVREEKGLRPGGLGLAITRSLVDELIYNEARNEVVFVKYLD